MSSATASSVYVGRAIKETNSQGEVSRRNSEMLDSDLVLKCIIGNEQPIKLL